MQTATKEVTKNRDRQISYRVYFSLSFLIWLSATVVLRLWGHTFYSNSNWSMVAVSCFSDLSAAVGLCNFQWKKVLPHQRLEAAVCLVSLECCWML